MMFSSIRKHLNPTTVLACAALVFAMTGGAFAATGGSGGRGSSSGPSHATLTATAAKSKAKSKTKAGPKGPAGPAGKNGTNGTNGAPGATGPAGPQGTAGDNGSNGSNGEPGTSVTSKQLTNKEAACNKEGGSEFTAGTTKTTACNGKEGSPWTAGGTLPKGSSEKGEWGTVYYPPAVLEGGLTLVPISFGIPLTEAPAVHVIKAGEKGEGNGTGCPATSEAAKPEAEPGSLCIFIETEANVAQLVGGSPTTVGTRVFIAPAKAEQTIADGTWAVTAE